MKKIITSEWISLDSVFDASLMGEWNAPYHSDSRAEYIRESIMSCGTMLYGRKTYEMLVPYWSALKNNEMGVADKLLVRPVIMGKGKRFFQDGMHAGLQLTDTRTLDLGVIPLYYKPKKN